MNPKGSKVSEGWGGSCAAPTERLQRIIGLRIYRGLRLLRIMELDQKAYGMLAKNEDGEVRGIKRGCSLI